ncbi:hypothetical protein BU24DRAFT_464961 [Aaosphaeria arxii CBS 175.79]|uniref:Uncharacterized protein n=1 Tax=Aaosphaeria arxii CBS 175.79 TaxID=1450172 RepID=A0A6A5XH61_9PLEO|nr:uncharacterized protein BU24DRAFT_464961 [Aaosphaeria arxii CBS 175.79]KAF2012585.1 hypothetical protein BU24DRAFT_464961 [Aaosphaeria arxii CBS 175.79]
MGSGASWDTASAPPIEQFVKRRKLHEVARNWWWEICAIVVSLVATGVIFIILLKTNGQPLSAWHLPIQLNSFIALCSTIAKSALLVVLAEGISQLKWNHFERTGGARLGQLQVFDDASRGPWGSLVFPWKMLKAGVDKLALLGAALTVLIIVFEPFTQQIIDIRSRSLPLRNETGFMRVANSFALATIEFSDTKASQLVLMKELMQFLPNLTGQYDHYTYCPTGECGIPDHWSLAACSKCQETVLNDVDLNIRYGSGKEEKIEFSSLSEFKAAAKANGEDWYRYYAYAKSLNDSTITGRLDINGTVISVYKELNDIFRALGSVNIFWIDEPFNVGSWGEGRSNPHYVPVNYYTSDVIVSVHESRLHSKFPAYEDLDDWHGIEVLTRKCDVTFCGQYSSNIKIDRGGLSLDDTTTKPLNLSVNCGSGSKFGCHSDANFFGVDQYPPLFQLHSESRKVFGDSLAGVANSLLGMEMASEYLINTTAADFSGTLTKIVNSFLRSEQNFASIKLSGVAFGPEPYVHVRWRWAIFPCAVTFATVLFLVFTMSESSTAQQMYKSSALTGYFHKQVVVPEDLDNISDEILRHNDTAWYLEKVAQRVHIRLQRDSMGKLEFARES